ncbi:hypothetical protein N8131_08250 [Flavobacteriaceae bacterium]|nr:hypothetical protein [Flavobacteriaceae bacterium]
MLDASVSPVGAGTVIPSEGTYKEGSSVTLNAAPKGEYLFDRWSGDASGTSSSIDIQVDGNKNVTANFVLKKYELSLSVEGQGRVTETIVNTGKGTDYDSGTTVKLEAVPSTGYYFSGWSSDITSETNPIEVKIDSPKTIKATFKKLSYELSVLTKGEGTVKEEIINTSKSTDYEFETTVRLTATPEQGSDFIEWEESGATNDVNPFEIIVTEPKTITAVFEYGLFNKGVGKWKIRKPKIREGSQKSIVYNVYSIIFNRNRSFRLNYSSGQISGTYSVTSNSNITLNNHGSLSNVQINQGQISFNLNITGLFQFNVVGSRVQTYQQNRTYIPDQNFEQALVDGGYDTTIDTYIDDSSMLGVTQLDLSNRQITDFTGLEEFINLTDLNLSGNTITAVPLVNLNGLTTLNLSNTSLTQLDLSQNSNITSLNLSGNSALSCVEVSQQVYQQVPLGWIYDSTTSFELVCDCPTLTLTSGTPIQELCDGEAIQSLVYEFGGTGTTINVGTMPSGLQSSISSGTLTISGTPVFTNNDYSFLVFTTDGNADCSQVSQTVTLSKNQNSPSLTLDSGAYNQTIETYRYIDPIEVTFGGGVTDLSITSDIPFNTFSTFTNFTLTKRNKTYTIAGYVQGDYGTYTASITTVSNGGCTEITKNIKIIVLDPLLATIAANNTATTGGTTTSGTTSGGTTTSGNTTTSGSTTNSSLGNFQIGSLKFYNGNLYVGTQNKILKINSSGTISTYLGSGGEIDIDIDIAGESDFITGLEFDSNGAMYFGGDRTVRKLVGNQITTVYSNGVSTGGIVINNNNEIFIGMCCADKTMRKIDQSGNVSTYFNHGGNVYGMDIKSNIIYMSFSSGEIKTISSLNSPSASNIHTVGSVVDFLTSVKVDQSNNLYILNSSNNTDGKLLKVVNGSETEIINNLWSTRGLDFDDSGNLYVGDMGRIHKVAPDGTVTEFINTRP